MTREQMEIIEWLKEYDSMKASIQNLNECIEDIATANMGISYDRDVVSKTYKFNSNVEDAVVSVDDKEIRRKIKILEIKIKAINNALKVLDNTELKVIKSSCMSCKPYYSFCGEIQCSERTARRIRKQALKKMEVVIFGK